MIRAPLFVAIVSLGAFSSGCKKKAAPTEDPRAAADASVALFPLVGDASGGAFGADGADEASCVSICELRAAELHCSHPERCRESCGKLRDSVYCVKQVRAFLSCFTKAERRHWECNDDGMPVLGHWCELEQGNIADCLMLTNGKL